MPYCENCGKPLSPNANFCGDCGTRQKAQAHQSTQPLPPPPPQEFKGLAITHTTQPHPIPEQILSFLIVEAHKRFGKTEYFTGILTSERFIFAPMTKEMLKEVSNTSREQAKGKLSQGPITYPYQQTYLAMGPAQIMATSVGCFTLANNSIRQIELRVVGAIGDGYSDFSEYEMKIASDLGVQTYRMTKRDEYVARIRQSYQDKLRLL